MSQTVLELSRTFLPFHDRDDIDANLAISVARAAGHELCWEDVLSERYVVILGEAGTGKTTEFQLRAATGRAAASGVFVRLAELASDGLELAIAAEDSDCLGRWRAGSGHCHFFLDALDEAKLARRTLSQALRRLRFSLGNDFERARLLVSCRPSDWRPRTDLRELQAALQCGNEPPSIRLLQIAPLDDRQIQTLASNEGVADLAAFMDAIHAAGIETLAGRPQDVKWLAAFWSRRGRLGTLEEVIEENINNKLQEIRDADTTLSNEAARAGAMALAGIATLTGRSTMIVPDGGADAAQLATSIDPVAVLLDWSNDHRRQLLTRGLFDEATYGRVRFHERRVREYLAAKWLAHLDEAGLPRRELNRLLFRSSLGRTLVPQSLGPTTAWLSLWNAPVRSAMTRAAPEHLIDEGDPGSLSIEDRASILRSYCTEYAGRRRVAHRFDRAGLRRFATDSLAPTISELFATGDGEAVTSFLLELVAAGRLRSCVAAALRLAVDDNAANDVRVDAVMAVGAAGSPPDRRSLTQTMLGQASIENELAAAVLMALFPEPLDVPGLVQLITRVPSKPEGTVTLMDTAIGHHVPERCTPEQRIDLLKALMALVQPADPSATVVQNRSWLLGGVAQLLADEFQQHTSEDTLPESVLPALELFQREHRATLGASAAARTVQKAVAQQPWLRRLVFWRPYELVRRGEPSPTFFLEVENHLLARLTPDDACWLAEDARSRDDAEERLTAFQALRMLPVADGAPGVVERTAVIEDIVSTDPALAVHYHRPDNDELSKHQAKWAEDQRLRDERERQTIAQNRATFEGMIDGIRAGTEPSALAFLTRQAHEQGQGEDTLSLVPLETMYGAEIACAVREGLKARWLDLSNDENTQELGRIGLVLAVEDGLEIEALGSSHLRVALEHATRWMNGFPAWLDTVAPLHPALVCDVFRPVLKAELQLSRNTAHARVLPRLTEDYPSVRNAVAPLLAELLSSIEPSNPNVRDAAVRGLLGSANTPATVGELAATRCGLAVCDQNQQALWWCAWMNWCSAPALDHLEQVLADGGGLVFLEAICSRLWRWLDDHPPADLPVQRNIEALTRFIPVLYRSFPPAGDVGFERHRVPRYHCQRLRDAMVSSLAAIGTEPAYGALQSLADRADMRAGRDWLLRLVDEQASKGKMCAPWSPDEAWEWSRSFVRNPSGSRELFQIALDRLDDIRLFVETDDHSYRQVFTLKGANEEHLQKWLAAELSHRARGRYSGMREVEVDLKKRPDIRLYHPSCKGPVSIEVKIADRWTWSELETALHEQLVGQYLRAAESRYGVLLLCRCGKKKHWIGSDGGKATFAALVEHLDHVATEVHNANGASEVDGVRVIGIDFTVAR